jgi:SAM-dependent methyltransferase
MSDAPRPPHDFDELYRTGSAPWDIGRPQAEVVRLAAEGEIVGDVIDLGCGTGENALHLASLGRRVLGVDGSSVAVALAREKAAARGLQATFLVGDALHLRKAVPRRFETGIDCGLFHLFERDERRAYAHALTDVLSSGSTLHLLCFSDEEPAGPGPRRLAEYDIRDAFRSLFTPVRIRPASLERDDPRGPARAWLATLIRI